MACSIGCSIRPARTLVLWLFLGWPPFPAASLLWAVTLLAAAAVIAIVMQRVLAERPTADALLVALLAFAAYPVQVSVFVGQCSSTPSIPWCG